MVADLINYPVIDRPKPFYFIPENTQRWIENTVGINYGRRSPIFIEPARCNRFVCQLPEFFGISEHMVRSVELPVIINNTIGGYGYRQFNGVSYSDLIVTALTTRETIESLSNGALYLNLGETIRVGVNMLDPVGNIAITHTIIGGISSYSLGVLSYEIDDLSTIEFVINTHSMVTTIF